MSDRRSAIRRWPRLVTLTALAAGGVVIAGTSPAAAGPIAPASASGVNGDTASAPTATISVVAGSGQSVPDFGAFSPLVARVAGSGGEPLEGVVVTFHVTGPAAFHYPGEQSTDSVQVPTDAAGTATTTWSLIPTGRAGRVTVTASAAEAAGTAIYRETVTPSVDVATTASAPSRIAAGSQFPVQVTVTNRGPTLAWGLGAAVLLPPGVTLVNAGGGMPMPDGSVRFGRPFLARGQSVTFTITVRTAPTEQGMQLLVAGAGSVVLADSNPRDNSAVLPVEVTAA